MVLYKVLGGFHASCNVFARNQNCSGYLVFFFLVCRPLFGQLSDVRAAWKLVQADGKAGEDDYKFVTYYKSLEKNYGQVYALTLGMYARVNVCSPDLVKEVRMNVPDEPPRTMFYLMHIFFYPF